MIFFYSAHAQSPTSLDSRPPLNRRPRVVGRRVRKKGKEQRFAEPPRVPGRRAKEEKARTVFVGNVCCFDVKTSFLFSSIKKKRHFFFFDEKQIISPF
jgi:hypothetical protein